MRWVFHVGCRVDITHICGKLVTVVTSCCKTVLVWLVIIMIIALITLIGLKCKHVKWHLANESQVIKMMCHFYASCSQQIWILLFWSWGSGQLRLSWEVWKAYDHELWVTANDSKTMSMSMYSMGSHEQWTINWLVWAWTTCSNYTMS